MGISSVGYINKDETLSASLGEMGWSCILRHPAAEYIRERRGEALSLFWFEELICCFGRECHF